MIFGINFNFTIRNSGFGGSKSIGGRTFITH